MNHVAGCPKEADDRNETCDCARLRGIERYSKGSEHHKGHPEYEELGVFAGYMECEPMTENYPIRKTTQGFMQDCGQMELVWGKEGKYLGQYQDNMLDDEPGGPDKLFINAHPESDCQAANLTLEQMKNAVR